MSFYYLEVTRGIEQGRRYPLPDGSLSVGRSSQNDVAICPAEKSVSGHHAIIYKNPGRLFIQDLQSTNGTFVNEEKVAERELKAGDELGFGKGGPRLKLITSDTELPLSAGQGGRGGGETSTGIKTVDDDATPLSSATRKGTDREDRETVTRIKFASSPSKPLVPEGSQTLEVEKKLLDKQIGSADIHSLMKDGKRIEKLAERGNVSQTQVGILRTMQAMHRKNQTRWLVIVGIVVCISALVASYFAIRAYQYRSIVNKAENLEDQLDIYEKKIAAAKKNPEKNREELKRLVGEFEEKENEFSSLKSKINTEDFGEFYTDPLEKRIDQILMRFGETDYHVPEQMVQRVRYHIDIYSGRMHKTIGRYLRRKEKYFPMIFRVFKEKNLPPELAYISMLESGFNPRALSHAGARGLWQFMPRTGRNYGLRVDNNVDERLDPLKATYAAAEYFRDLIGIFGGKSSVMLAMAGYNAGEGRVMGALRKIDDPMRNRDFWYIYRMGYLAEETNEYIPRVLAMMIIAEDPQKYGFDVEPAATAQGARESEEDFLQLDFE